MDNNRQNTTINWYPGHMAKTKREIREKLNLIDVVYEVIDARMPLSSKIVDIDELIKNKPRILIMTKYDLCDKKETEKFIAYYQQMGYQVVPMDLMNQVNVKSVIQISEQLLASENEKRKAKGLKPRTLRALVIGIPNVGKSTLINRLAGKKAASIGNRPGVTKSLGWIRLNKNIDLLDTPGILWPKFEDQDQARILAMLSSIKEEILDSQDLAIFALGYLSKLYPEKIKERYGVIFDENSNIDEVIAVIARKRGALKKGNEPDEDKVYQLILQDIKNNIFKEITLDRMQ